MLRALSGKRGELARCMAFSLEHAEAAHEVRLILRDHFEHAYDVG